jgi:hypothetical protein
MEEAVQRAVMGEVRRADQVAAVAGRDTQDMGGDLERWTSEGRMLSVQHKGDAYFALFALNHADLYRPTRPWPTRYGYSARSPTRTHGPWPPGSSV